MKILHLDNNHPLLQEQLAKAGFENASDYTSSKENIEKVIEQYDGIVIRSRFTIDKPFLDKAMKLKFIARVGAGLESIDEKYLQHIIHEPLNRIDGLNQSICQLE